MNPSGQHVRVPTRERANSIQVETVRAIIAQLNPYLLEQEASISEGGHKVNPSARKDAETTFGLACARLDKMLVEDSRWEAVDGDSVVNSIKETQAEIRKYYAEQTQTISEMRRPSRIFHPQFAQMGGTFSAFHASSDFPGGIIIGTGSTPAEAMADFDKAFNRIPAEQLKFNEASLAKIYAAGLEPAPEQVAPKKPARKQPRRKK